MLFQTINVVYLHICNFLSYFKQYSVKSFSYSDLLSFFPSSLMHAHYFLLFWPDKVYLFKLSVIEFYASF